MKDEENKMQSAAPEQQAQPEQTQPESEPAADAAQPGTENEPKAETTAPETPDKKKRPLWLKLLAVFAAALAVLLAAAIAVPLVTDRSFAPLAAAAGYGLAVWYGFRQLDGMNGDISGFALTLGELAGAAVWTLVR